LTIKIRPMVAGDKAEIMKILHATPEFTPEEVKVAGELIDLYLQYGTNSEYYLLVADDKSSSIGYICYGPTPMTEGTWDIYWIAVASDRQNKGIGRALLTASEEDIKKKNGRLILIETSSKNEYEKTRGFYRARNYESIACIPDFYSPGDDKLLLRKVL
jgi:ribosomal protein S18 acetylase RimI-like enzyme